MAVIRQTGLGLTAGTPLNTNGVAIPAGTGETQMTLGRAGGQISKDTTNVRRTAAAIYFEPAANSVLYIKPPSSGGVPSGSADFDYRVTGLTGNKPPSGSEFYLLQAKGIGGGTLFSATWTLDGYLRLRGAAATTLSTVWNPSVYSRIALGVRINTSDATQCQARVAAFKSGGSSPVSGLDTGWVTGSPSTTGVLLDIINAGRCNNDADATPFWVANLRLDYAASDLVPVPLVSAVNSPSSGTMPYTMTTTVSSVDGTGTNPTYAIDDWGDGASAAEQPSNSFSKNVTNPTSFTGRNVIPHAYEDAPA